jgi:hypothetical protein
MFAAGAAIGSAVTYKVVKTKYDRLIDEEIESVKAAFAGNEVDVAQEKPEEVEGQTQINWEDLEDLDEEEEEDDDTTDYERLVNKYSKKKGGAEEMAERPYVISPYDYGELDDYHQFELTYYADGTLEDEDYNIVDDVDDLIGQTSLYTFGEYEDDSVFVRNDRLRADFQILKDYRTYEEARGMRPDQVNN